MISVNFVIISIQFKSHILDYFPEITTTSMNPHVIQKGTKLFQLVHPSTLPLTIRLVDEVGNTERGTGAFGSTGM